MLDIILAIIWIAILVLYIVVGWKDAKSNNEVKSVCSKSLRDRKDQEGKREKATERDTPEKETPESGV